VFSPFLISHSLDVRDRRVGIAMRIRAAIVTLFLLAGASSLFAQQYTAADVEIGRQLFTNNCISCHGPEGDAVQGVDLGHGHFRLASSDNDLVRIMRNGIPGTGMPANNLSQEQATAIVAYLRSVAASAASNAIPPGDVSRGKATFEGKGECLSCHRVGGVGSRLGPDLSGIGRLRRLMELQQALLEPAAEVRPNNRFIRAVTQNGTTISGRLLNQDTFTVQLLDSREQLVSLSKSDLREFSFVTNSPMPSYKGKLSSQEAADLVSYLASLKAQVNP
jgi:putative heme-binding domain-containing protein